MMLDEVPSMQSNVQLSCNADTEAAITVQLQIQNHPTTVLVRPSASIESGGVGLSLGNSSTPID
eukprot:4951593-Amphidinium_carterae.2